MKSLAFLLALSLSWLAVTITGVASLKLFNIIPSYCGDNLEFAPKDQLKKEIQLKSTGNESFVHIGASVPRDVTIVPNYRCFIVLTAPPNRGLILTVRKASLNDKDTIIFRSGTNPERVWKQNLDDNNQLTSEEVVSVASKEHQSTISVNYEPTVGKSEFNAGFDLAVTVYREKEDSCSDTEFDCLNSRCISANLQCDGYNNCGNSQDEAGCSGVSWLIVAILIAVAICVVVLAILVWVRMSKA